MTEAYPQSGRARQPAQPDSQTIRLRAEEVLVPVTIQTDSGKLPDRLSPSDLIVAEDNTRRTVTSLVRAPASIVLIVDNFIETSGEKNINLNRDAALRIIESMGSTDTAAVITYAGKVDVLSALTGDKNLLRRALTENFKPAAHSHLYDSLTYAAENLLAQAPGRHSIVLFTDGYDAAPRNALDEAKQALDRARATLYIVDQRTMIMTRLGPLQSKNRTNVMKLNPRFRQMVEDQERYIRTIEAAQTTLADLAAGSGGQFWDPPTELEFTDACRSLISDMGSEFVVAYTSERPVGDTKLHDLQVYPNRLGLKVRIRHGVYSKP
jgi:VWFA-related protein